MLVAMANNATVSPTASAIGRQQRQLLLESQGGGSDMVGGVDESEKEENANWGIIGFLRVEVTDSGPGVSKVIPI
jgi:hypothetical protein